MPRPRVGGELARGGAHPNFLLGAAGGCASVERETVNPFGLLAGIGELTTPSNCERRF